MLNKIYMDHKEAQALVASALSRETGYVVNPESVTFYNEEPTDNPYNHKRVEVSLVASATMKKDAD